MLELESPDFDEQLTRAVAPVRYQATRPEVAQAQATRAAMLNRQGINGDLAYSERVVQELTATYERERTDRMLARWCGVAVLALVLVAYFGWLA
jgi:hypothetical protein